MGAPPFMENSDHSKPPTLNPFGMGSSSNSNSSNTSNRCGATYVSLVQQYLSVFQVDNAIFLAERCVAEYPGHAEATYLLALAHYRKGHPRTARHVLQGAAVKSSSSGGGNGSSNSNNNNNSTTPSLALQASMQYLAAQCSVDLQDYGRAEIVLLESCRGLYKSQQSQRDAAPLPPLDEWILQTTPCPVPNGAAGLALLGTICRRTNRRERAAKYFEMSLRLDPFLWTSFEALAELGRHELDPAELFGVATAAAEGKEEQPSQQPWSDFDKNNLPKPQQQSSSSSNSVMMETPAPTSKLSARNTYQPSAGLRTGNHGGPNNNNSTSHVHFETPGLTPIPVNNSFLPTAAATETPPPPQVTMPPPPQNPTVLKRAREVAARHYYPPSPETPMTHVTKSMRYLRGLGQYENNNNKGGARSLFGENQASNRKPAAPKKAALATTTTTPGMGNNNNNSSSSGNINNHATATAGATLSSVPSSSAANTSSTGVPHLEEVTVEKPKDQATDGKVQEILELLSAMGKCYQQVCSYQCRKALKSLQSLPVKQQVSGWVLHQQGRAHLELNDFASAERALLLMQVQDPSRLKGLELLSTVYWQLKKEVELAHLAQKVTDWDRLSPQAWCVVGNCFSLQKDHETALVFFQRSLQLDPNFTYTHTLAGYEYMANENFDMAIGCFRQALRTDDRHYNAWYGLGAIYQRQEKYDLAEYHFEKAVTLNPSSSALRCNLGMAQFSNGKAYQALDTLKEAFALDYPRNNPQARFQRANIYMALHRPEEALEELLQVRAAAPREATVHFSMGKVYKKLGQTQQALKCFLTAMDLDQHNSKGNHQAIKTALEKLEEPDASEEAGDVF